MKTREVKNVILAKMFDARIVYDDALGVCVIYPDGNKVEASKLKFHRDSFELNRVENRISNLGFSIHERGGSDYFEYGITGQGFNEIRRITGDNIPKRGNNAQIDVMINFITWYEKNK